MPDRHVQIIGMYVDNRNDCFKGLCNRMLRRPSLLSRPNSLVVNDILLVHDSKAMLDFQC